MHVPSPTTLVARTEPPIASTSPLTMDNPSPLPLLNRSPAAG